MAKSTKKAPAKKAPAAKLAAKKPPAKKPAAKAIKPVAKKPAPSASKAAGNAGATTTVRYGARADKGSPITGYVNKLTGEQRAIADKLVSIIESAVPEAESGLKWGMPMWTLGGEMLTYLRAQKSDVRWGLAWVSGVTLDDPDGLLQGTGKDGKHVKLLSAKDIDASRFTRWLNAVAQSRT